MSTHDPVLSAKEIATELGVHYRTVLEYIADGRLAAVKIGKRYFIRRSAVEDFLNPQRHRVA